MMILISDLYYSSIQELSYPCYMFTIAGFTGIDQAYEAPDSPELVLHTDVSTVNECVQGCVSMLERAGIVPKSAVESVQVFHRSVLLVNFV